MYKIRTSINSEKLAKEIATTLIVNHVAVSVHIRPVTSMYEWKGKIQEDHEYEVEILANDPDKVYKYVRAQHSYELPEYIYENVQCGKNIAKWCNNWCGGGGLFG